MVLLPKPWPQAVFMLGVISFGAHGQTKATFRSDPYREYQGRTYDFSQAIKWLESKPPPHSLYPDDSPLTQDWHRKVQAHHEEGIRWTTFLVVGNIREQVKEGTIIEFPVEKTIIDGSIR